MWWPSNFLINKLEIHIEKILEEKWNSYKNKTSLWNVISTSYVILHFITFLQYMLV